jgi:putative FmdB family regulatory protein
MPLYEYRCEQGHTFEVMQKMSDDPVQACEVCGSPVQRVFHPVAVHFKGSGFYNTDYGKSKRRGGGGGDDGAGSSSGNSDSSGDSKPADSKPSKSETSTSTSSASSSGD